MTAAISWEWRRIDPLLAVAALALAGYGALVIYSASLPPPGADDGGAALSRSRR